VWITTDGHAFANGVELDDAEVETLLCDATIMGHVDDPNARPKHTLTQKQRDQILARDMRQCSVPGLLRVRHPVPRSSSRSCDRTRSYGPVFRFAELASSFDPWG
jgi:hypothetical protein